MKKVSTKAARGEGNGMRAEYDFTGGVRGKHYRAMQAGYTITIHQADGTTVTKEVKPKGRSTRPGGRRAGSRHDAQHQRGAGAGGSLDG